MASSHSENEEIAKAMRRQLNAEFFKEHIKESLEEMIIPRAEEDTGIRVSDDRLIFTVFPHIDLLGYLYKGGNSSVNAVGFMREYLGRVDRRYQEVSGLIYDALRHGYVHLATPKRIKLRDGKILDFSFIRSGNRGEYLQIVKMSEMQRTGERIDIYRLCLDLPLFYMDLLSAMDKYAEDIEVKQELSETFREAFETRRKPEKAREEDLLDRPYIQQTDFDFVRARISQLS